jgi:predicted acetyltransferase
MVEFSRQRANTLQGELATGVQRLLRHAFPDDGPNEGDYYRAVGVPELALVLRDGARVIAHLGLYTREVEIGGEPMKIGMVGGIAVAPDCRRAGHARDLIQRSHDILRDDGIAFSILFAFEPKLYLSSGYRLMLNPTRFIDTDGTWKTFIYRGSMFAELGSRPWPNLLLDLQGRTV